MMVQLPDLKSHDSMKTHYLLPGIFILFFMLTISCKNGPVQVYPANPHYFSYKGQPIVLITSDHHYGAIIDQDFDYVKYLKFLGEYGMNLTRIYPGGMFEPADKYLKGNPLGPRSGRQLLPWARSEQTGANPSLAEPGQPAYKYDLDTWNPQYFDRLKAFVELARQHDIIVEIPFFNGMYADCWPLMAMYHENNIQNIGQFEAADCGLFTSMDIRNKPVTKYQKAYIQKIATELNAYDNVIYDICDEPSLQGLADGSIIVNPDSMIVPWIYEMKEAFLQAEKSLPKKHLIGQTVQNLSPDFSKDTWCEWLPCEYVRPAENALNLDYQANKPIVNVESNYFRTSLTKNAYTADAVRIEGWWFMLSGGAGSINLNGEYYRENESGQLMTRSQIAPQRKILKEFMDGLDLSGLTRFTKISGTHEGTFCNGLAENGKQYALYLFHGSYESEWGANFVPKPGNYMDTLTLNDIPEGNYLVRWFNPVTGAIMGAEKQNWQGGNFTVTTPPYSLDIALKINNSR
jgi:hypothetical protein